MLILAFRDNKKSQGIPNAVLLLVAISTDEASFLTVPCKSVHNYILERPILAMLDVVASTVHIKKYHNYF